MDMFLFPVTDDISAKCTSNLIGYAPAYPEMIDRWQWELVLIFGGGFNFTFEEVFELF